MCTERLALAVAAAAINSCFEASISHKWESSSRGAHNVIALGRSTKTSGAFCGCRPSAIREEPMHLLMSPIHHVRTQRARRRQLRTALHMLSASGVIRPSHVEPRYYEPSSHVDALYRHETTTGSTPVTVRPLVA